MKKPSPQQRSLLWLLHATFILAFGLAIGTPVLAGRWITPGFLPEKEPDYKPVPLYWFEVKETPYAYRTVIQAKEGLKLACAQARSSGYLYVFVDGKPVFEYVPQEGQKADPNTPLGIDVTPYLTPGRHCLVVSAPREGFALDGVMEYSKERMSLATDASWQVKKFPPTVILEDEPWMLPSFKGRGAPVAAGRVFQADYAHLVRIAERGLTYRTASLYEDTLWRLGLLSHKGIVIIDGSAYGWAGASRANPHVISRAHRLYDRLAKLTLQVDKPNPPAPTPGRRFASTGFQAEVWLMNLTPRPPSLEGRGCPGKVHLTRKATPPCDQLYREGGPGEVRSAIQRISRTTEILSLQQYLLDELKALRLASLAISRKVSGRLPTAQTIIAAQEKRKLDTLSRQLAGYRKTLTRFWGHPLNVLNESRYDRLGWLPHPDLVDSQMASWGLRVNPVLAPTTLRLDGKWLFNTDPGDAGESEKRQTIGYNIENQWPGIEVPGAWNRKDAYKNYKGTAWYRTRIHIPAGWRGHNAVLRFQANDTDKVWVNDVLTGSTDMPGVRNYTLDKNVIRPGAENVLAFKITAHGDQRGIISSVSLSCPDLIGQKSDAPTAQVLATPLSPAVALTVKGTVLEIQGWAERKHPGPKEILLPLRGTAGPNAIRRLSDHQDYRLNRDGRLSSNWAILWMTPADEKAPDRPVMLAFQKQPASITHNGKVVRITFPQVGVHVVAVRPWVKQIPEPLSRRFQEAINFWQRAALAIPVNYMELTRKVRPGPPAGFQFNIHNVPQGPILQHIVIYDYLTFKDDRGTKPLKVAPMPAMGSYAIDTHFRGLKVTGKPLETVQDGGLLAPYRVLKGTDRITYSYPIEPFERLAGFTSFMFSYADTGVPGNKREMELLKTTGSNCYRPQHNFSTERSPYFPETETRTRVQILTDYCNAYGMTYMNNIDQTLGGPREEVQKDYPRFMEKVTQHLESVARQLHHRPFHDVAYDLINEPFDHKHEAYNKAMKALTARIRAIDPVHLLYIEPCEAWGAIEQLKLIEPTGDPLTVYSFHDYNFRLFKPEDRWPTEERDISSICRQWTEAFKFAIQNGTGMHCGEFGGFDSSTDNQLAQMTLMNDFFRIFDQFGMHFNYYSGRTAFGRRADGSMALSNVVRAYRRYFKRGEFNLHYR